MGVDYRNTKYDCPLEDLANKKQLIRSRIVGDHPQAKDMHAYLSKNNLPYKSAFIQAYNGKCAYCGVSIDIIPKRSFEIDHFIHEKDARFGGSKAAAGYIENLVLACNSCNGNKKAIEIPDSKHGYLHPDNEDTAETFIRDDQYYIQIADNRKNDDSVTAFYQQLKLASEIHRIDYLLMNMIGLQRKLTDKHAAYAELAKAVDLLRTKRNIMG